MNHFKNYKPSKVSRNFLDQLAKILVFHLQKQEERESNRERVI